MLRGLLSEIFRGALRDLQEEQKKKREEEKRRKRIEELEGGEEEYEARESLKYYLPGVGEKLAGRLYRAGYETGHQAKAAPVEELKRIDGIGKNLAKSISREGDIEEWELGEEIPYDHYTDAVEHVKKLKRERRHEEAEELLRWCIDQTAKEKYPAPWYFKHLAIVYRKDGRHEDEVAVIERYIELLEQSGIDPGEHTGAAGELVERLDRAKELAAKNT